MTLTLKCHVTLLFCAKIFFSILDVLDIPDDFGENNFLYPYKGSGLRFFGVKFFLDHVTFLVPHTLFVILDILDIPDEFGVKQFFFLKKDLDLEYVVTRTFFRVFSYR